MDFPRPSMSASNIIGDLKDRFGLGGGSNSRRNDDAYYDDAYYDDYDEPAASGAYDNRGSDSADPYDRLEYTTRSTGAHSPSSRRYGSASLVSSNDIRATTSAYGVYDSSATQAMPSYAQSPAVSEPARPSSSEVAESLSTPAGGYGDFVSPYKRSGAASSSSAISSPGLDSLFTPSTGSAATASSDGAASAASATKSSAREVVVLKPTSYEDVSSVAQSVRSGHIVVLSLRATDAALSMRVLDFAFGVASALNAKVECVAEKNFAIYQGKELTLEESHSLAKQGVTKA